MNRRNSKNNPRLYKPRPWHSELAERLVNHYFAGKLHHALLLLGPAGVGKRVFADCLGRFLLCQKQQGETQRLACGECESCALMQAHTHPDLYELNPEDDSRVIKIDQVRELCEKIQMTAQMQGNKVVLISPADQLNEAAANALLKLLEEPPPQTHFLLVADQPQYVLPTVRSRCLPVNFGLPPENELRSFLSQLCDNQEVVDRVVVTSRGFPEIAMNLLESSGIVDSRNDGDIDPNGDSGGKVKGAKVKGSKIAQTEGELNEKLLSGLVPDQGLPDARWLADLAKQPLSRVIDQLQREVHQGVRMSCGDVESLGSESADQRSYTQKQWLGLQALMLESKGLLPRNPNATLFLESLAARCRRVVSMN